jgi:hypothetical protein
MLDVNPENRPSVNDILNGPWFEDKNSVRRNRPKSSPPKKLLNNHLPTFKIKLAPLV